MDHHSRHLHVLNLQKLKHASTEHAEIKSDGRREMEACTIIYVWINSLVYNVYIYICDNIYIYVFIYIYIYLHMSCLYREKERERTAVLP